MVVTFILTEYFKILWPLFILRLTTISLIIYLWCFTRNLYSFCKLKNHLITYDHLLTQYSNLRITFIKSLILTMSGHLLRLDSLVVTHFVTWRVGGQGKESLDGPVYERVTGLVYFCSILLLSDHKSSTSYLWLVFRSPGRPVTLLSEIVVTRHRVSWLWVRKTPLPW